jgi:hypothetical protein
MHTKCDERTDGQGKNNMPPSTNSRGGIIKTSYTTVSIKVVHMFFTQPLFYSVKRNYTAHHQVLKIKRYYITKHFPLVTEQ